MGAHHARGSRMEWQWKWRQSFRIKQSGCSIRQSHTRSCILGPRHASGKPVGASFVSQGIEHGGRRVQVQAHPQKDQPQAQSQQVQTRRIRLWRVSAGLENRLGQFENWSPKYLSRFHGNHPAEFSIPVASTCIEEPRATPSQTSRHKCHSQCSASASGQTPLIHAFLDAFARLPTFEPIVEHARHAHALVHVNHVVFSLNDFFFVVAFFQRVQVAVFLDVAKDGIHHHAGFVIRYMSNHCSLCDWVVLVVQHVIYVVLHVGLQHERAMWLCRGNPECVHGRGHGSRRSCNCVCDIGIHARWCMR